MYSFPSGRQRREVEGERREVESERREVEG
jgi:hypothetical protein